MKAETSPVRSSQVKNMELNCHLLCPAVDCFSRKQCTMHHSRRPMSCSGAPHSSPYERRARRTRPDWQNEAAVFWSGLWISTIHRKQHFRVLMIPWRRYGKVTDEHMTADDGLQYCALKWPLSVKNRKFARAQLIWILSLDTIEDTGSSAGFGLCNLIIHAGRLRIYTTLLDIPLITVAFLCVSYLLTLEQESWGFDWGLVLEYQSKSSNGGHTLPSGLGLYKKRHCSDM